MHKIKEKLMNELYEVEEKMKKSGGGKISAGDLSYIHTLTDTIKNICKIDALDDEEGYSEATDFMGEGRMYGMSYARGGRGRGRNARRDSMGRYSRDGGSSYDGGSYEGGSSYARGGQGGGNRVGGRGGNRGGSSYGYSMDDGIEELKEAAGELFEMAENHEQKQAIKRFMQELDRM